MLSDRTIREINDQIHDELRTVHSIMSNHEDKMAAIERINALKKILEPTPETASRAEILRELAAAFFECMEDVPERSRPVGFWEELFGSLPR